MFLDIIKNKTNYTGWFSVDHIQFGLSLLSLIVLEKICIVHFQCIMANDMSRSSYPITLAGFVWVCVLGPSLLSVWSTSQLYLCHINDEKTLRLETKMCSGENSNGSRYGWPEQHWERSQAHKLTDTSQEIWRVVHDLRDVAFFEHMYCANSHELFICTVTMGLQITAVKWVAALANMPAERRAYPVDRAYF